MAVEYLKKKKRRKSESQQVLDLAMWAERKQARKQESKKAHNAKKKGPCLVFRMNNLKNVLNRIII